jgi:hypothetical protein
MSIYALIVGVVLVAAVGTEGDRYAVPNSSSSAPAGSVVAPLGGLPAATDRSTRQPAAGSAPVANPFSTPPAGNPPTSSLQPLGAGQPHGAGASVERTPPANLVAPPNDPLREVGGPAGAKPAALAEPSALMRAMLAAPRESRLTGQPIGLADAVAGASSRTKQTAAVDAYWDLCSSVADYHLGLQEQAELRRLRPLVGRVGPTWQQAESELAVRIGTSQRAAAASQYRLAGLMGRGVAEPLPLPGDMPHCGEYRTRYEQIFTNRSSNEATELNELLPLRYEELSEAAGAVARAEEWLDTVAARRSDNSDGTGMLRALELLALRRRAFVQIARDYNRRIARYAELAAPREIAPDVLVGMLIKTDRRAETAGREAPPAEGRPSQPPRGATPGTRGADWTPAGSSQSQREQAVTPASAEVTQSPRQERSLLVPPNRR